MSQINMSNDEDTGGAAKAKTAAHEASEVTRTAGDAARGVAETGKHEAAAVAGEAKARFGEIVSQSGRELSDQAATQQRRLADGLGSIGSDLSRMADADENGGMAGDLVRRAAGHLSTVGGWLGDRDPQQLLQEVTSFARRRPGTFIAVAAIAGVVVGRLSRAIAAGAASGSSSGESGSLGGPRFAQADAAARSVGNPPPLPGAAAPVAGGVATSTPPFEATAPDGVVGDTAFVGSGRDDTGLIADVDGGDPPLYSESAARLEGTREEGSHDRSDTV
ncbi:MULTISPECIES: hypothetical protein [Microbacterium]|uniref:hypothetical protein n=1 Tax=Microbacterium TaxID=33882 RepID=UPI00277DB3BE|nr:MULTISPECIES: hypothetical protein [Microbacterium]MDQ1084808.1 ElaB/YqjD/DUF883 family membrane-anchored ribosome-binding protein [Microbacterium sp. SORGH_AS_0344]MDQ1169913.1 ElaB/YqjD/DUF883 family membrane-anchored ribosome-binding protein [Microbacterium proteolyticum]